jgi:hypothetical protein
MSSNTYLQTCSFGIPRLEKKLSSGCRRSSMAICLLLSLRSEGDGVGLINCGLNDLLLLRCEVLGHAFVELWLLLLEFCKT